VLRPVQGCQPDSLHGMASHGAPNFVKLCYIATNELGTWIIIDIIVCKDLKGVITCLFDGNCPGWNSPENYEETKDSLSVCTYVRTYARGPFAKFVDSLYYSESELYGGAVTVSFSKYLHWQAMHFLQRSTHFSKTCCRPLITTKFLALELPFRGWESPEISWGEI
jgi:hypothetical protein